MGVDCIYYHANNGQPTPTCLQGLDVTKCNTCFSRRSASLGVSIAQIHQAATLAQIAEQETVSDACYADRLAWCMGCPALNRTNSRGAGIGYCSESLAPVSQFTELTIMARSRQTRCPRGIWPEPT